MNLLGLEGDLKAHCTPLIPQGPKQGPQFDQGVQLQAGSSQLGSTMQLPHLPAPSHRHFSQFSVSKTSSPIS